MERTRMSSTGLLQRPLMALLVFVAAAVGFGIADAQALQQTVNRIGRTRDVAAVQRQSLSIQLKQLLLQVR